MGLQGSSHQLDCLQGSQPKSSLSLTAIQHLHADLTAADELAWAVSSQCLWVWFTEEPNNTYKYCSYTVNPSLKAFQIKMCVKKKQCSSSVFCLLLPFLCLCLRLARDFCSFCHLLVPPLSSPPAECCHQSVCNSASSQLCVYFPVCL